MTTDVAAVASNRPRVGGALASDARGGLAAGLLTLVTTIAYATAAGAPMAAALGSSLLLSALIGAAVGGGVAALFAPIGVQVHSPRASVALIVAAAGSAIAAPLGPGATLQTLAWLSVCMLLAALLQAGFGLLRMGALIRLVPRAVGSGFTIGIALQLLWSQRASLWPGAKGLFDATNTTPLLAGLATVAVIAWMQCQRARPALRVWSVPLGLVLGIALCAALQAVSAVPLARLQAIDLAAGPLVLLHRVFDVDGAGDIAAVLPRVFGYALVLAFVNALETLTCGLALEARLRQRFDANRALIASAIGSLASACVGGLPVAGSAAVSVANVDAGARSRRSSLLAAAAVSLLAVPGHGALPAVPLAALAGVTLVVAWGLAWQPLRELLLQHGAARAGSHAALGELAVAALVVLLLLVAGSAVALLCGVLAASMLALVQMRRGVVQRQYDALQAGVAGIGAAAARQIRIIEIGQPLLFANVEPVVQAIEAQELPVRCVVIDLTRASAVDASAARALADCGQTMSGGAQMLLIVRPASAAASAVAFDACPVFDRLGDAIRHGVEALQAAPDAAPDSAHAAATETECERATRLLLPYVGPIASVLVARAQRQSTSLDDCYRLLAQQLPNEQDGVAFLDAAGRPLTRTTGDAG
jgi:sulfate permease, SulP family